VADAVLGVVDWLGTGDLGPVVDELRWRELVD